MAREHFLNPFAKQKKRRDSRELQQQGSDEDEPLVRERTLRVASSHSGAALSQRRRHQISAAILFLVGVSVGFVLAWRASPDRRMGSSSAMHVLRRVPSDPFLLRVMTFNLRYGSSKGGPASWPERRRHVADVIAHYHPLLVGTQEGLPAQLQELQDSLPPTYARVGEPREPGGEHAQIFYDSSVVELRDAGTFWLSETPTTPYSKGWDAKYPRVATWGLFRLRATGLQLVAVNTHLDARGEASRREGVATIWTEMKAVLQAHSLSLADTPLFLTGDFNTDRSSAVYSFLTRDGDGPRLQDAWLTAEHRVGSVLNTYHDWLGPAFDATPNGTARPNAPPHELHLDWILARPAVPVVLAEIITESRDGHYPSDHYPVVAEFLVPSPTS
ncbi:hypothetical protein P43SY_004193 [Pythium insidiosum]|uniref:Endonuclease/exonuclease/phosphatase domain-containing protein n=1 Tax=Pythium insidiosum TaxID=114742 RepID=A0AAD5LV00_PYTIN|nr:hypothetical protein P43SY_004193 [Pythium insidiosum]